MLCLFDTNGGTLPSRVTGVVAEVCERFDGAIGIHAHNDSEVAVANSLTAVEAGATLVDGCRTATESAAGTQVLLQGTTQNRSALVGKAIVIANEFWIGKDGGSPRQIKVMLLVQR